MTQNPDTPAPRDRKPRVPARHDPAWMHRVLLEVLRTPGARLRVVFEDGMPVDGLAQRLADQAEATCCWPEGFAGRERCRRPGHRLVTDGPEGGGPVVSRAPLGPAWDQASSRLELLTFRQAKGGV